MAIVSEPQISLGDAANTRRTLIIDTILAVAIAATTLLPSLLYDVQVVQIEAEGDVVEGAVVAASAAETMAPQLSTHWLWVAFFAIALPLSIRRVLPRVSFGSLLLIICASSAPAIVNSSSFVSATVANNSLPLLVSVFTIANLRGRLAAFAVGVMASATAAFALLRPLWGDIELFFSWVDIVNIAAYALVPIALAVVAAQILRDQRLQTEQAQRETAQALISSAQAVSQERRRLAAELHDIVAHHVNLMVIQAEKGPYTKEADATTTTFGTIAQTGRAALGELDRLLGILKTEGSGVVGTSRLAPLPTIDEITELVNSANRAGVPITLTINNLPATLDAAIAATAHRIVQEAITNIAKHGDTDQPASIVVETSGNSLDIIATNHIKSTAANKTRQTHGLDSIRSRVQAFGGQLDVTRDESTFVLKVSIPIDKHAAAAGTESTVSS